jgi:hypothetical protein
MDQSTSVWPRLRALAAYALRGAAYAAGASVTGLALQQLARLVGL